MLSRRKLISSGVASGVGLALAPLINPFGPAAFAQTNSKPTQGSRNTSKHYKLPRNFGIGGTQYGNQSKAISDQQSFEAMEAAWSSGVRYFDTSPFYGYGLSERRYGLFLNNKPRDQYILSTKVGRVFHPGKRVEKSKNWIKPSPFEYTYDYSASGTRKSVEDSLQRLGLERIDIVFVHDLIPGNKDLGPAKYKEHLEIAKKGAFQELTKMREEGIIKAWGLGVNEPDPIYAALEVSDPDLMLCATQYSLMKHDEALDKTFPACQKRNVAIVVGAPLNNGFISGANRYDYDGTFPKGVKEKREKMNNLIKPFDVDLRTVGLQFCAAHPAVAAVIPGCRSAEQAKQNYESMKKEIPADLWKLMKDQKLIAENAPVPGDSPRKVSSV